MSRRRRRSGPPRCKDCRAPVIFFRSPFTGGWRPFEVKPIGAAMHAGEAFPVENNVRAWRYRDLVEDLMVRLGISEPEAEEHAHAMPWHVPHNCPNRPEPQEPEQ